MSQGSVEEFKANWQRPEAEYCHFTRDEPVNQIQFAFRQNWLEFAKIMEPRLIPFNCKHALEMGAGRGTMSMYFAKAGFFVYLLDACDAHVESAKTRFVEHGFAKPEYTVYPAEDTHYQDNAFDVVHSYGLLEHIDNILSVLKEQYRVLKSGGVAINYVVPEETNARHGGWELVNRLMARYSGATGEKQSVHRNGYGMELYLQAMKQIGFDPCGGHHVYPIPVISPSPEFPFTLNPPEFEKEIVGLFRDRPWKTVEETAQAFIVWGWKK